MASTGVNVLRYSALGAGLFYGLYHQASLSAQAKLAQIDRDSKHKQSLIDKAKAEYSRKNAPASAKSEGDNIITDPEDKNFDLEAYLNKIAAETK